MNQWLLSVLANHLTSLHRIEGEFEKDDIVKLMNQEGMPIGVGRVAFDSMEARQMLGKHAQKPLVHYDYLYLE